MISPIRNLFFASSPGTSSAPSTLKHSVTTSSLSSLQKLGIDPSPKDIKLLHISSQNQETIHLLLKELATESVFHLACNSFRLTKIGATLKEEVHPYLFLLEILSNPSSKKHLEKLHEDRHQFFSGRSQIWNDFAKNLGKNFEDREEEITPYTFSFAEALQLDPFEFAAYIQEKDWEGLLAFLITKAETCQVPLDVP